MKHQTLLSFESNWQSDWDGTDSRQMLQASAPECLRAVIPQLLQFSLSFPVTWSFSTLWDTTPPPTDGKWKRTYESWGDSQDSRGQEEREGDEKQYLKTDSRRQAVHLLMSLTK